MYKGNCTESNEANVFLPLGSLPVGTACGFSFVNWTQQRVRGLLCEQGDMYGYGYYTPHEKFIFFDYVTSGCMPSKVDLEI